MVNVFVIVIGSFELPINRDLIRWRKQIFKTYNIPHRFVFDEIPEDYTCDPEDLCFSKVQPPYPVTNKSNSKPGALNPHMILKFIKALQTIDVSKYDYILRLNLSTYVHFPKCLRYLETAPRTLFCGGYCMQFQIPDWKYEPVKPQQFLSGTCIVLSTDICKLFQAIPYTTPVLYEHNDDVVLSYIIKSLGIPLQHISMVFLETDSMATVDNLQQFFLFRIKHSLNRSKDYYHWKFCMAELDSIRI